MKNTVVGILAHVDAGKTTLSEALLYKSETIRKMGRVDTGDAFLDNYRIEKERGITVFSKQAELEFGDTHFVLVDTPGHVDFSAEMERSLQILDYAILIISALDGVTGHTLTVWNLLRKYEIPTFVFVNKTDMAGFDREECLAGLKNKLAASIVDFEIPREEFFEEVAGNSEELMEKYFENIMPDDEDVAHAIARREIFPCYFGSALKLTGIDELLKALDKYTLEKEYGKNLAARVYKISTDERGERLTFLKVTGGVLKSKSIISNGEWEEKANLIRIYSGKKFRLTEEAAAGSICAVTGLTKSRAGDTIGSEQFSYKPVLEPVLSYRVIPEAGVNVFDLYNKMAGIGDEIPELNLSWDEVHKSIIVNVMGDIQTEILTEIVRERLGVNISLGTGKIIYHETIADEVIGVGHFEPLRHYAEVVLRLEPLERGRGLEFAADCSEDILDRNWQRLILQNLGEKNHKGVLTGSTITDMKITVIGGRAHNKHTEGGDFRKAVYRAVRQGLMQAESILLEPTYRFRIEVDSDCTGRIMSDIINMKGTLNPLETEGDRTIISGIAPVSTMHGYARKIAEISHGTGAFTIANGDYMPCHNQEEVVESYAYNPLEDVANTPDSVFCSHGSGTIIPWNEVFDYMHCELGIKRPLEEIEPINYNLLENRIDEALGTEEIDRIIAGLSGANKGLKSGSHRGMYKKVHTALYPKVKSVSVKAPRGKYTLVDAYNVIFAWDDLAELAKENMDAASDRLLQYMCEYQAIIKEEVIVVFDAYRVKEHATECFTHNNIYVVYTKEAETADRFIERFVNDNVKKYDITVVTSDGLEQIIIRGDGAKLISSRELYVLFPKLRSELIKEHNTGKEKHNKAYLGEIMPDIEGKKH